MNAEEIYRPLGVSPQVCAFGERVLRRVVLYG